MTLLPKEDRATQGCDPSAGWEWINGRSGPEFFGARLALPESPAKAINPWAIVFVGLARATTTTEGRSQSKRRIPGLPNTESERFRGARSMICDW